MITINNPIATQPLRNLWQEAFQDTGEFLDNFFNVAFSQERSQALYVNDELAAALYWFDCELESQKTAYIYAVATAKKHRGKGYCKALLDHTHKLLKESGYAYAVLVPSEASLFEFYKKLGYTTCGFLGETEVSAAPSKTELQRISTQEFAVYRRLYLPENAVIQEKENLDFLATQAEFFKGEDFLLSARLHRNKLFAIELLGNTDKLAEITASLGAQKGYFRTVGNIRPFAMGISLNEKPIPCPIHFGLAFD